MFTILPKQYPNTFKLFKIKYSSTNYYFAEIIRLTFARPCKYNHDVYILREGQFLHRGNHYGARTLEFNEVETG